jgi:hypothetical protein
MPSKKQRSTTRAKRKRKPSSAAKKSKATKSRKLSPRKTADKTTEAGAIRALQPLADIRKVWADIGLGRRLEFRVSCVRPDDLLVCDFIFENLRLDSSGETAPKLARRNTSTPVLIVEFPPQSFGEEAFMDAAGQGEQDVPNPENLTGKAKFPEKVEKDDVTNTVHDKNVPQARQDFPGLAQAKIRMSGPSRIAFSMPAAETELPFTIEAILDACRRWPMRLDVNAVSDTRIRFRREVDFRDVWLGSVVNSNAWKEAKEILVDTVGNAHLRRMASAAHRVTTRAVDAIRAGSSADVDAMLHGAINEELDVLAQKLRTFRDQKRREAAAAAISFMATENLTEHRLGDSVFDLMKKLPFVRLIFPPHEPAYNVTALELPYRLILSPTPASRWHHPTKAVTRNGRTELWHTRLTSTTKDVGPDGPTRVRALWSDDYKAPEPDLSNPNKTVLDPQAVQRANDNLPFRMSLDPLDRLMLVALMSGFDLRTKQDRTYHPLTADSRRLQLSSLGALLEVEGQWDPPLPRGIGLQQWRHVATLGRDHYVRVVYRGFLCHPRHAASLVKVTERKFESVGAGVKDRVAVLRQRFFIVVREREKHYGGIGVDFAGRKLCFTDIEITTRVTPTLLAPDNPACRLSDPSIYTGPEPIPHRACFWPMIGPPSDPPQAKPFLFDMIGTDRDGKRIPFSMPLLFVGIEANEKGDEPEWWDAPPPTPPPPDTPPNVMTKIRDAYNHESNESRRSPDLGCFSVCYAPPKDGAKGDPRLPTTRIFFMAMPVQKKVISTDEAHFYPAMERSMARHAAVQRLLQKPDVDLEVQYADAYLKHGFDTPNTGEVFLKLVKPFPLTFGKNPGDVKSDAIGGIATPDMSISGLSRIMGPVSTQAPTGSQTIDNKLEAASTNQFKPTDFFKDAKILGGVKLAEIIGEVTGLDSDEVPKLLSRETKDAIEASFDWKTSKIKNDKDGMFLPNADGRTTTLTMQGVVSARRNGSAPTFSATASLVNFKVNLFGFVTVWFDKLEFRSRTGQKPDVAVDLHPGEQAIEFGGPLEFVNDLRSIIPSNGFSDPPGLSVTPSGISASYSIGIPSLAVGIFALENISLGAGFLLPFDAQPAEVRFNFAERQRPFSLTVAFLGGGGFFAIGLGSEGVREIEAALEFGAALSIDLGVASGSVEVKAGVYYHWKTTLVELEGYVRLHGELDVLGLISASLTFHLKLGYTKQGGQSVVWGEAMLEVEIEILFLSFSVSVKCRREFGGCAGDPKFIELIPDQAIWDEYCGAFANDEEAA